MCSGSNVYEQTFHNRIVGGDVVKRQEQARSMLLDLRSNAAGWKTLRSICTDMARSMEGNPGTIRALALATEASGGPPILGLMSGQMKAAVSKQNSEFYAHHTERRSTELEALQRQYRELETEIRKLESRIAVLKEEEDRANVNITQRALRVDEMQAELAKKDIELRKLREEIARNQGLIGPLKEEYEKLRGEVETLQSLLASDAILASDIKKILDDYDVVNRAIAAAAEDDARKLLFNTGYSLSGVTQLYSALRRERHAPEYLASGLEHLMSVVMTEIDRISDIETRNKVIRIIIAFFTDKMRRTS